MALGCHRASLVLGRPGLPAAGPGQAACPRGVRSSSRVQSIPRHSHFARPPMRRFREPAECLAAPLSDHRRACNRFPAILTSPVRPCDGFASLPNASPPLTVLFDPALDFALARAIDSPPFSLRPSAHATVSRACRMPRRPLPSFSIQHSISRLPANSQWIAESVIASPTRKSEVQRQSTSVFRSEVTRTPVFDTMS